MSALPLFPFRGTYRLTPRSRKERVILFYAPNRGAAFQNLVRVTDEESHGKGVPGYVDPMTCEEAYSHHMPFMSHG